jgi:hypothetical protein
MNPKIATMNIDKANALRDVGGKIKGAIRLTVEMHQSRESQDRKQIRGEKPSLPWDAYRMNDHVERGQHQQIIDGIVERLCNGSRP